MKIDPCPFCKYPEGVLIEADGRKWRAIMCGSCGARGPETRFFIRENEPIDFAEIRVEKDAVAAWNNRGQQPE